MARFTKKIESIVPFEFCDKCGFYEESIEKLFEDNRPTLFVSCKNAEICLNALRLAKVEEYDGYEG